jgi:hypothetical protein
MGNDELLRIVLNGACAMAFANNTRPSRQAKQQVVNELLSSKYMLTKVDDMREMDGPFRLSSSSSLDVAIS